MDGGGGGGAMNRLTFGLTSLSKSLVKAWKLCEDVRLKGQPVHTLYLLVIFPPSCIVFLLNDPLPDFCCLEQNIINYITPPLLDQSSPRRSLVSVPAQVPLLRENP